MKSPKAIVVLTMAGLTTLSCAARGPVTTPLLREWKPRLAAAYTVQYGGQAWTWRIDTKVHLVETNYPEVYQKVNEGLREYHSGGPALQKVDLSQISPDSRSLDTYYIAAGLIYEEGVDRTMYTSGGAIPNGILSVGPGQVKALQVTEPWGLLSACSDTALVVLVIVPREQAVICPFDSSFVAASDSSGIPLEIRGDGYCLVWNLVSFEVTDVSEDANGSLKGSLRPLCKACR